MIGRTTRSWIAVAGRLLIRNDACWSKYHPKHCIYTDRFPGSHLQLFLSQFPVWIWHVFIRETSKCFKRCWWKGERWKRQHLTPPFSQMCPTLILKPRWRSTPVLSGKSFGERNQGRVSSVSADRVLLPFHSRSVFHVWLRVLLKISTLCFKIGLHTSRRVVLNSETSSLQLVGFSSQRLQRGNKRKLWIK